jgi:hypothetical protein
MVNWRKQDFTKLTTTLIGILGVTVLAGGGLVFGQNFSAAVSGFVRDSTGAVIPGTTVTAKHIETGLTRAVQSNEEGGYTMPQLPVGSYEVTAEKPGFRQQVRRGITLVVAQEAVVNLTLDVGDLAEKITVTEEIPIVNTTLNSVSGLINEQQVKDMPLNGRSFNDLLVLNTSVNDNRTNTAAGGPAYSIAGKRQEVNRWTINGMDYVGTNSQGTANAPNGMSDQLLGVEAVREYNVLGHTYGAEYGKRSGGQITVVTTSGTNQWHGSAFEYLRNNKLDARNFYTVGEGAPPFKRNQFGGSLGGPIVRDKMFIFGTYEGFRERLNDDTTAVVPSAQARQGLIPCYLANPTNTAAACPDRGAYVTAPNLVPGILPFMRYWPAPNGPEILQNGLPTGSAYYSSAPYRPINEDFGLARFDYTLSGRDSLSTSFNADRGNRADPQANPIMIQNQGNALYTLSAQETHIFSATVVNTGTFGYARAWADQDATPTEPFPDSLLFMKGGNRNNPGALIIGGGTSTAQASTFTSANGQNPLNSSRQNFTGSDDLRVTRGRHNLSMGGWLQRVEQGVFSSVQNNAGTLTYPTLLAMLQDRPTQFQAAPAPVPLLFRTTEAAWYFQDEVKLRPNLTVRLGLRDELTTGWNETNGRGANYLYDYNYLIRTQPNVGKSVFVKNYARSLWQPRVGVAWDPTGTGRWAVRAAFGIHNDLQDNLANRMNSNPPFNARLVVQNTPLLTMLRNGPLPSDSPGAPSCSAESPLQPPACSIFAPGGVDPSMHTPTTQEWSLEVERGITQELALQLEYVGSESYHLPAAVDMNSIPPVRCTNPAGCLAGGTLAAPQWNTVPQGVDYIPAGATRPNRFVGATQTWMYLGTSSYHGGSVSLTKRARSGLTFKTSYTLSKVLDINSGLLSGAHQNEGSTILTRFNLRLNKGIASYSVAHDFTTNFLYQLPFGNGKALGSGATGWVEKLIGNWQWNGIVRAQSGFPAVPLVGSNRSGNGDSRNPDVPNWNPNFKGNPVLGVEEFKKTGRYFDPNAFLLPLAGTFGNVARGALRGPGLFNVNTSLFKRIPLKEQLNLQFRVEAFNVFNHANFSHPELIVFSGNEIAGSAGTILSTAARERQIQFALRLEF